MVATTLGRGCRTLTCRLRCGRCTCSVSHVVPSRMRVGEVTTLDSSASAVSGRVCGQLWAHGLRRHRPTPCNCGARGGGIRHAYACAPLDKLSMPCG
eukprot:358963-Chlamydomonas_euryale.AAC.4